MKSNFLLIFASVIVIGSLVAGTMYNNGSPGAKTGSPLDGNTCTQCHTGSDVVAVDWLSSDIPETGWIPGETYTITATGNHETFPKIGFELTAENTIEKVGVFALVDETNTKFVNNNKAVTHLSDGNIVTDGVSSWEVSWTAPETNMGDITFYAAFNAANGNGNTSGDEIFNSAIVYSQDASTTDVSIVNEIALKIFPNPASKFIFIQSPFNILEVKLFSTIGSRVKTFSNLNSKQSQLDLSGINKGIYIARIKTNDGEFDRRIQLK